MVFVKLLTDNQMVPSNVNVKVASLRAMESARTMTNVTIKHTTAQRMKSVKTWVRLRVLELLVISISS